MAKPDYIISAKNKFSGEQGIIGAAWNNPDKGYISIRFNPFVVLPVSKDIIVGMFPVKEGDVTPEQKLLQDDKEPPF